ncbi:MAG: DNA polymerase III subunit chi [Hydrogenophaga sp.]|nr:DNA polymerase III subunit chi [Hydrogenophaga sp.]
MTEVAFHFNVQVKVGYACRLLRKAHAQGSSIFVLAEPDMINELEAALWTLTPDSFVPHCLSDAPPYVTARTPILIGSSLPDEQHASMLLNLQREWIEGWDRFEKVFEVVTLDDSDRQAARDRLRRYRVQGADPVWHEIKPT